VHHLLIALATTPAPTPTPSLRPGLSEDQVTPGTWGFIMTAFFVIATTLLIVDMVRRIRRVRYRAQVEEERMAAATAADVEAEDAGTRGVSPLEGGRPLDGIADETTDGNAEPAQPESNGDAGRTGR
jgi:hypothetical protein